MERLPVIRSKLHGAAEHRDECAVESLALAVGLRAIRSTARLIDSKCCAQLNEERRFELRSTIRGQLLRHSVAGNPFCIGSTGTRRVPLVSNVDGFCLAVKAVYHRQDRLIRRRERMGVLAGYSVVVELAEELIRWQMCKRRVRKRDKVAITIVHFVCFRECRDVTVDARPPEALCNAELRRFVAVVRGLVECVKHLFAKGSRDNNARGDGALITVLEERVFDDKLWPRVCECFQCGIRLQLVSVGALVRVQEVNHSGDCWVSALLRDPVGARVEAIAFCDGASVELDASCELCGDFSVN